MSLDLDDRLRRYAADLDAAVDADRMAEDRPLATVALRPPTQRRRVVLAAAGLLVAAAVVAVVLVGRPDGPSTVPDSSQTPTTGAVDTDAPSPTVGGDAGFVQTQDFGSEVDSPPVPDGWQVLDFRDFRFAVPEDWTVPISGSCAQPSPGVVLVDDGTGGECSPAKVVLSSFVSFSRRGDLVAPQLGNRLDVGTLNATVIAPECATCKPTYQFDNGWNVVVAGPQAAEILATFTDSGARRMLQSGPTLDSSAWQSVQFAGVQLAVPSDWELIDLPGTKFTTTDPSGNVVGGGGVPDPGTCSSNMFGNRSAATAFTGTSGIVPGCLASLSIDLAPHDGLWLRGDDGSRDGQTWLPIGEVDGVQVELLEYPRDRIGDSAARPLELRIPLASGGVLVSIGAGPDAATARTVLRSVRVVDGGDSFVPAVGDGAPSLFDDGTAFVVFVRHGASAEQIALIADAVEGSSTAGALTVRYLDEAASLAEVRRTVTDENQRAEIEASLPTMFKVVVSPGTTNATVRQLSGSFLALPNVIDVRVAGEG